MACHHASRSRIKVGKPSEPLYHQRMNFTRSVRRMCHQSSRSTSYIGNSIESSIVVAASSTTRCLDLSSTKAVLVSSLPNRRTVGLSISDRHKEISSRFKTTHLEPGRAWRVLAARSWWTHSRKGFPGATTESLLLPPSSVGTRDLDRLHR